MITPDDFASAKNMVEFEKLVLQDNAQLTVAEKKLPALLIALYLEHLQEYGGNQKHAEVVLATMDAAVLEACGVARRVADLAAAALPPRGKAPNPDQGA